MKRKRFIKLMMSDGFDKRFSVRAANRLVYMRRCAIHSDFSYQSEWDKWIEYEKRCLIR